MPDRSTYRHGALAAALLDAGTELARTGGPDAVGLREATRRVGVSPNAAYRHFADHSALLRAVAARAMEGLAAAMLAEQAKVPEDLPPEQVALLRLRATGAGYLAYARAEPGLFRTAFSAEHVASTVDDPEVAQPYGLLSSALDALVDVGLLPPERRPDTELLAWSSVHGLAMLLLEGPLRSLSSHEADVLCGQLLDHVQTGLVGPR